MNSVLILDSGGAHAMAIAESLKTAGYRVVILSGNKNTYGYNTRFLDERYLCPGEHDTEYAGFVLNFLKEHKVDVIIPTSDNNAEVSRFVLEDDMTDEWSTARLTEDGSRVLQEILHPQFEGKLPKGLLRVMWWKLRRWWAGRWKMQLVYQKENLTVT